ncbi:MAG: adenylyl-sulfate kinase [Saprospiraceae bacterium]
MFHKLVSRAEKEQFLNQKGMVLWLTGLSGSGKSTIAQQLEKELLIKGYLAKVLDGDNIRSGINNNLGFSMEDRDENIRRIAEIAKLFVDTGIITICSFISPTVEIRAFAKEIIGNDDFLEIYINTPLEVCEKRDVKGLYKKARTGALKNFTGIDSPYEPPIAPDLEIKTIENSIEESTDILLDFISQKMLLKKIN